MHERDSASHAPRGVSVTQAARLLGIAPSTVRRHIRDGQLDAIRELRPQGSAWRVFLPSASRHGASEQRPRAGASTAHDGFQVLPQERSHELPCAESGVTAPPTTRTDEVTVLALAALVDMLTATRAVADARAEMIASLSERFGTVTAERDAARGERDVARTELETLKATQQPQEPTLDVSEAPQDPEPSPWLSARWWCSWWRYGVLVGMVTSAVMLLMVPR